jgi:phage repressor protein C with HTH and peptisase S24 domain
MQQIDQKITTIISHFNLNNYAFSKRIGVTGTTIDSIINGRLQKDGTRKKTKPGYDVLNAIINVFDINPNYLFGKSKVMLNQDLPSSPSFSSVPQVISVTSDNNENVIYVPIKARAGYLNGYADTQYIQTLPSFYMPNLAHGTFRCFEVQGHSMVSTFFDGDLVFAKYVEQLQDIKNDQIYVVISKNDGIVLKRIINTTTTDKKLILKSDNKDGNYPDFSINIEDIMEIWHVKMFASKQIAQPVDVYDRLHELETKLVQLQDSVLKKDLKNN